MISGDAPGGWGLLLRGRIVVEPVAEPLNRKAVARVTRSGSAVLEAHGSPGRRFGCTGHRLGKPLNPRVCIRVASGGPRHFWGAHRTRGRRFGCTGHRLGKPRTRPGKRVAPAIQHAASEIAKLRPAAPRPFGV